MTTTSITCTQGIPRTAVALSCAAGEELVLGLTLLTSAGVARDCSGGTVSFSFERPSRTGTPLRVAVNGQANGIHTITVAESATRLLDGQYTWDAWFTPASGAPEKLALNGTWTVTPAVGSGGDNFGATGPAADETELTVLSFADQVTAPAYAAGNLFSQNGFLTLQTGIGGTSLQIGLEQYREIYNGAAVTLSNGQAAYLYGSNTQRVDARPAANGTMSNRIFGIATHDISSHADGLLTTHGDVNELNTQAHAPGTFLYTSDTDGVLTATEVPGDKDGARMGMVVVQHPSQGRFMVDVERMPRLGGTTANRPVSPRLGTHYFDTTINCLVIWNGTAWQLPVRPGYADLIGDVAQAAAVGGLTNETHRDTPFPEYYFRHDQDDTLYLKWQMKHDWDLGGVEPHIHVIGCSSVTGNVRLTGRYCWSSIGGNLEIPIWSGWTTFTTTHTILGTDQWIPRALSIGTIVPPAAAQYPSAFLRVQLIRPGSSDALDTYTGSKPAPGTAAANLMLDGVDCHIKETGLGTAGLYS